MINLANKGISRHKGKQIFPTEPITFYYLLLEHTYYFLISF